MERPLHTARLRRKQLLSARTHTFHFQFELQDVAEFPFEPGQFISVVAADGRGKQQTRAYSLASAPNANRFDLCINRVEGGFFSNLLADMDLGDAVQIHGPHGLFTLRQPLTDAVMIATGTGIAPMLGFIQWLFPEGAPARTTAGKPVTLVYGTRYETELYYRNYFEAVAAEHKNFRYLPTLSRAGDDWQGLRGYVQDHVSALLKSQPRAPVEPEPPRHAEDDLAGNPRQATPDSFPIHAYICGLNQMVSANREQLKSLGWHRKQIVFERYD